ncbi:MAG: patatin-like phospholipase family protein [Mycobacterium leprae]
MKRALVLGGGGPVGIGWEAGLAAGLASGGVSVATADLLVGTSAGSVVGAVLATGIDPMGLLASQQKQTATVDAAKRQAPPDLQAMFARWNGVQRTPAILREIGAMSLSARTQSEGEWLGLFEHWLGHVQWPDRDLLITAIDTSSGEFTVWSREAGVPLAKAVASSCAVPGVFPPVTIKGNRYMDGGFRTNTNADLAVGADRVLVVNPSGRTPSLEQEMEQLTAGGATIEVIGPDEGTREAAGQNWMDESRTAVAAMAGFRQGKSLAKGLKEFWC